MGAPLSIRVSSMRYPDSNKGENLIEDLCLDVPPDSIVSLLGRSGAGKTTLLRMIAGLERRFSGKISLNGGLVSKPSRDIQIVFQDYRLLPWKTVYENIEFATKRENTTHKKNQIERWVELVGLSHRKNAWPKNLSGGEKGRVAFARAFVDQPKVLLLDEPFRGLDLGTKFDLQDHLLNALQAQRTTIVMVSHSVEDAVFLSDSICILSDSPMSIDKIFDVGIKRPRNRGDQRLSMITAEITEYLASHRQFIQA